MVTVGLIASLACSQSFVSIAYIVIGPFADASVVETACNGSFVRAQRQTLGDLAPQIDTVMMEVPVSLTSIQISGQEGEHCKSYNLIHD